MMLTALNANDQTIIDVTALDLEHVYMLNGKRVAQRHGYDLICKGCHHPAHLVRNHHKTVFFRHNPGSGNCIIHELSRGNSESAEHLNGKATLLAALHDLTGWTAKPEQIHTDGTDTVIVDVEATYTNTPAHDAQGHFPYEVQLARQTAGEFQERSATIRRVVNAQPVWLTPHAAAVGNLPAIICNDTVELVTDRFLTSYEPRIDADHEPVAKVIRSIHRHNPGHRWFQMRDPITDEPAFHVVDIDAFRTAKAQRTNSNQYTPTTAGDDTACPRVPKSEGWQPIAIDTPHTNKGDHTCAVCGIQVAAPWGFSFDPPMCRDCFQTRQARYCKHCVG